MCPLPLRRSDAFKLKNSQRSCSCECVRSPVAWPPSSWCRHVPAPLWGTWWSTRNCFLLETPGTCCSPPVTEGIRHTRQRNRLLRWWFLNIISHHDVIKQDYFHPSNAVPFNCLFVILLMAQGTQWCHLRATDLYGVFVCCQNASENTRPL